MNNPCGYLHQLQPYCIDPLFSHACCKSKTSEPVKEVVCQTMHLQPVGIYYLGLAAYGREIKTILAFFNEVFHLASSAVKLYNLIRFGFHVGDDEGIHEGHLVSRLFNLENNPAQMRPFGGFIHKFAVRDSIVNHVVFGGASKIICLIFGVRHQSAVDLKAYGIFAVIILTYLV